VNSRFREIGGILHKLCNGPAHEEPVYLPATEKYFYRLKNGDRAGRLTSRCRLCVNWAKLKSPGAYHGWIELRKVHLIYLEATNRIGLKELSRRSGVSRRALACAIGGQITYVQKAKVRLVLLELISIQRKNEHSISKGALWRQEQRLNSKRNVCGECNTPVLNYTDGCSTCWERKRGMERRKKMGATPRQERNSL
jgi:hypothetical protein